MNLKDIRIDDVAKFCKKFNCSLDEFRKINKDTYYLKMFTGIMGPQPEFEVTETSCVGINAYKNFNLTTKWLAFLASIETKSQSL